jgi:transposase
VAVGAVIDKHKMAKHIELTISDTHLTYRRKTNQIAEEAALDGLYAVRTSLPKETLDDHATVRAYKSLSMVERAFRCLETVDLHVRPIHHWLEERVRAHVFLCMLAYYVEWNLRARLAPMLYDDDDREAAEALRDSPVAKAQRSPSALAKSATGRTADGAPVHSFQSLIADLATLARNTVVTAIAPNQPFTILTRPTPIQQKAFDLLGLPIACTQ